VSLLQLKTTFSKNEVYGKLDIGHCLSITKVELDYDARGLEPATPVVGQATLRYWDTQDAIKGKPLNPLT
jgi:hypothetical protein